MDNKRTIEEILLELANALANPIESEISDKLEVETFGSIQGNDHLTKYLRETLNCDMKRYYAASTDENRNQIRGAFNRTAYLLAKITKYSKDK